MRRPPGGDHRGEERGVRRVKESRGIGDRLRREECGRRMRKREE